ncbi:hypothetical protein MCHI_003628 [Candidatus Magnetoovum chiemensis]|nr:hypothetical protein MCHI_003628 [Candidatus Magnetoovum chiemensis]
MKISIKISRAQKGQKQSIHINGTLSHYIDANNLSVLISEAKSAFWKTNIDEAIRIGSALFNMLNNKDTLYKTAQKAKEDVYIFLQLPDKLEILPFELIFYKRFLLIDGKFHIIRSVNSIKKAIPQKYNLNALFMACSPSNINDRETLHFEQEEEQILEKTDGLPLNLYIENTGSLNGLKEELTIKNPYFDIIHITGHGEYKKQPIFYMEDLTGRLIKVNPKQLWETIKINPPLILFLSACSTGKADSETSTISFAHYLAKKGIPFVLGWALTVSDEKATLITSQFYYNLSKGRKNIFDALRLARKSVKNHYSLWPLLRLFSSSTDTKPLIKTLKDSTKITPNRNSSNIRFVGRRRALQLICRLLKARNEKNNSKIGLLILAPAGVGKSYLINKVILTYKASSYLYFNGAVNINNALKEIDSAINTVSYDKTPLTLIFDDFHANLIWHNSSFTLNDNINSFLANLITTIAQSQGKIRLILTSRYNFKVLHNESNLIDTFFETLTLMTFREADLIKLQKQKTYITNSPYEELYLKYAKGNAYLLNIFNSIAKEDDNHAVEHIKQQIENICDKFFNASYSFLLDHIKASELERFLKKAAVFRIPVPRQVLSTGSTDDRLLQKALDLSLLESDDSHEKGRVYLLNPIIRDNLSTGFEKEQHQAIHKLAYNFFDTSLMSSAQIERVRYNYAKEAVYHALEADDLLGACKHASTVGTCMHSLGLYEDEVKFYKLITQYALKNGKEINNAVFSEIFDKLGYALNILGKRKEAIEYFILALEMLLNIHGKNSPALADGYNNLAAMYDTLGDRDNALAYYGKALEIDLNTLCPNHPNVSIRYYNIAGQLSLRGYKEKALEYYNIALDIALKNYGARHFYAAGCYNNIGSIMNNMGNREKAIEYYNKALDILIDINGQYHQNTASCYNNLGRAWEDKGDKQRARQYYLKAVEILSNLFDETHPILELVRLNLELLNDE